MAIPNEIISEIIDKANITDIVSSYVNLKRNGRDAVGLCPFHNEKTPSFHVSEEKQVYHCFGCGAGGSVVSFVMNIENLTFIDAVKTLGDRVGVRVPEDENYDDKHAKFRERLLEVNREAGKFFYKCLVSEQGGVALNYLLSRGLSKETIVKFGLGYAPDGWDNLLKHLKAKGFSEYEMMSAGLLAENREKKRVYDRFRNRVMFPVFDVRGNPIAFGGRVLDDSKPKYLNTNDTMVFDKSSNLFALNLARKSNSKRIIIAEGYMDVITLHQHGVDTAVASLGTAFTENQAKLLKRYSDEVVLCYDGDEAGLKAANRALDILTDFEIKARIITLKGAKDPDEFCKKFGVSEFFKVIDGAKSPVLYKISRLKEKYDTTVPEQKISFIKDAATEIAKLRNEIDREVYAKELSSVYDIPYASVLGQIKLMRKTYVSKEESKEKAQVINNMRQKNLISGGSSKNLDEAQKKLLNLMFYSKDVCETLKNTFDITRFTDEFYKEVADKITAFRENSKADIKESEFISLFPVEKAGVIAEILSLETHFENKVLGAEQLVEFIKRNLLKMEIGNDVNKAKMFLEQRKNLQNK